MIEIKQKIELISEFMVFKSNFFEDKINSMFKITKWKLFKENLNGSVDEICEPMHEGIPYSELSTGRKIIIGVDIVNSVARHLNISSPLFVDNFESVTIPIGEHNSQLFLLRAVEGLKKLKVETSGQTIKKKQKKVTKEDDLPF